VPVAGEDVIIESSWNMIFDLVDCPIYKSITINGRLSFKADMDLELKVHHLYNRREFFIGSETQRFSKKAIITLYDNKWSDNFMHMSPVLVGNKIIANVGTMKFFGIERTKMTRLHSEVI
jgi:hypothetical protein